MLLPAVAMAAAPEHDCDRQAADPGDVRRVGSSAVADKDINVFFGAIACGLALAQYPDEPRFKWQHARILLRSGNETEAVKYIREASDAGYPRAQAVLGVLYEKGAGVERNVGRSIALMRSAAEMGEPHASFRMGERHEAGDGVDKDTARALGYYEKAAAAGLDKAGPAVARLKTQIAAAKPAPPPAPAEPAPDRGLVSDIQAMLNQLGHDVGTPDGLMGRRTRAAIGKFQSESGQPADGTPSNTLRQQLTVAIKAREAPAVAPAAAVDAKPFARVAAVTAGEPVQVEFGNLPATGKHWVSVVSQGTPDDKYRDGYWGYAGRGERSGTMTFGTLTAGRYEARVYLDWPAEGYKVINRQSFNVAEPAGPAAPAPAPGTTAAPAAPAEDTSTVLAIQALLGQLGYDAGPPTGQMSTPTASAIIAFQSIQGLVPDGQPSVVLRDHLVAAVRARLAGAAPVGKQAVAPPASAPPPSAPPASAPPPASSAPPSASTPAGDGLAACGAGPGLPCREVPEETAVLAKGMAVFGRVDCPSPVAAVRHPATGGETFRYTVDCAGRAYDVAVNAGPPMRYQVTPQDGPRSTAGTPPSSTPPLPAAATASAAPAPALTTPSSVAPAPAVQPPSPQASGELPELRDLEARRPTIAGTIVAERILSSDSFIASFNKAASVFRCVGGGFPRCKKEERIGPFSGLLSDQPDSPSRIVGGYRNGRLAFLADYRDGQVRTLTVYEPDDPKRGERRYEYWEDTGTIRETRFSQESGATYDQTLYARAGAVIATEVARNGKRIEQPRFGVDGKELNAAGYPPEAPLEACRMLSAKIPATLPAGAVDWSTILGLPVIDSDDRLHTCGVSDKRECACAGLDVIAATDPNRAKRWSCQDVERQPMPFSGARPGKLGKRGTSLKLLVAGETCLRASYLRNGDGSYRLDGQPSIELEDEHTLKETRRKR